MRDNRIENGCMKRKRDEKTEGAERHEAVSSFGPSSWKTCK